MSDRLNEALVAYVYFKFTVTWSYRSCRSSGVVALSSLCIHPGKAVWVLYIDAICINYNGNAFDATLIAMVAALKNSKFRDKFS